MLATGSCLRSIDHVIGSEFARYRACFGTNVDCDDRPAPLTRAICMHSRPMLPCPKIATGVTDSHACRLDSRNAVTERLKACGFTVRDSIIHVGQRDLGQNGVLCEAPRQLEADDGSFAAELSPAIGAQRALAAREFRTGRHAVAGPEASDAFTGLEDAGAILVTEQLNGRLGFEPLFDGLESERGNAERKLSFGDARLHAENFGEYVTAPKRWRGNIVQTHITESIKPPRFHRCPVYDLTGFPFGFTRQTLSGFDQCCRYSRRTNLAASESPTTFSDCASNRIVRPVRATMLPK